MNSLQGQESPKNTLCGEGTSITIIVQNLVTPGKGNLIRGKGSKDIRP
jgi:hypothetical protein